MRSKFSRGWVDRRRWQGVVVAALWVMVLASAPLQAATPTTNAIEDVLTNDASGPVADGDYKIQFALCGDGFPSWLRGCVVAYVDECLGRGAKISSLRSELDISMTTLRR